MKKHLALAILTLAGCAAPQQQRAGEIAATPLRDFNLSSKTIPPVLLEARKHPYVLPADQTCAGLLAQVRAALGNALQKTVEGAIPFRGWVRKLSGAERHSEDIAASIGAGTARRAFLKGVAVARTCQVQAMAAGPESVYK
jgi:hypothetical protein